MASGLLCSTVFGVLTGTNAITSSNHGAPAVLAGSVKTAGGYLYTVRSGDTLWSIATRLYPAGDPRVLVSELSAALHGATLVPGERLVLP